MSEIDKTLTFIRKLKDMGCRVALDEFGAGFSSFYYLKRFDVDYLKIDGSFARDLAADESNRVFVKRLNDVATGMSKTGHRAMGRNPATLKLLQEIGGPVRPGLSVPATGAARRRTRYSASPIAAA
jgi:EAL domain-containing protein (putative c-di-GMP-specific phosphodiesterase class I)